MKEVLYYLYERRLIRQMRSGPIPAHIGIILDGNRRYGQRRGLTDPHAIYSLGARKLDEVLDWCGQLAIPAVTLWVFSTENFERPTEQVSGTAGSRRRGRREVDKCKGQSGRFSHAGTLPNPPVLLRI